MANERIANELRAALATMKGERDQLDKQISAMESLLAQMGGGAAKRGPGRPKGSGKKAPAAAPAAPKRGPGRPPKSAAAAPAAAPAAGAPVKRGPGRPKGSKNKKRGPGRPKGSGTKAPAAAAAGGAGKRRAPKWSAEAREAARQRMQAYWADRKKKG